MSSSLFVEPLDKAALFDFIENRPVDELRRSHAFGALTCSISKRSPASSGYGIVSMFSLTSSPTRRLLGAEYRACILQNATPCPRDWF
jgi:hypothetical protein